MGNVERPEEEERWLALLPFLDTLEQEASEHIILVHAYSRCVCSYRVRFARAEWLRRKVPTGGRPVIHVQVALCRAGIERTLACLGCLYTLQGLGKISGQALTHRP